MVASCAGRLLHVELVESSNEAVWGHFLMHNLWFMERWPSSPTCFASGAPGWRWSSEIAGRECVVESLSWLVSKRRAIIPICLRKVITLTSWLVFKQRVEKLHSSPDNMWTITSLRIRASFPIQSNREPSSHVTCGAPSTRQNCSATRRTSRFWRVTWKSQSLKLDVLGMCCLCCAVKSNGACIAIHIWLQMHEYGHITISSQHSQEKHILYLSNPIYCRARVQILPWRCECRRGFRQALEWRCRLDQAQTNSWNLDHVTYYMSLRYLHTSSCFQPANTVAVAVASCFPRCPTACFLCRQCPLQDRR